MISVSHPVNFFFRRLALGDKIFLGKIPYDVIGTARHRLWLQADANSGMTKNMGVGSSKISNSSLHTPVKGEVEGSGDDYRNVTESREFVGLTRGSIDHILALNGTVIAKYRDNIAKYSDSNAGRRRENEKIRGGNDEIPWSFPLFSFQLPPHGKAGKSIPNRKEGKEGKEGRKVDERTDLGCTLALSLVDRMLQQHRGDSWSREEDETLVQWVETVARTNDCHPLNVDYYTLLRSRAVIATIGTNSNNEKQPTQTVNCKEMDKILDLYSRRTDEDIQTRVLLLIHMNDLLLPLLPIVVPIDGSEVPIGGRNHPTQLLQALRPLVFLSVASEFTYKTCTANSSTYSADDGTCEGMIRGNKIHLMIPGRSPSPAVSPSPTHTFPNPNPAAVDISLPFASLYVSPGGNIIGGAPLTPGAPPPNTSPSADSSPSPFHNNIIPKNPLYEHKAVLSDSDLHVEGNIVGEDSESDCYHLVLRVEEEISLAEKMLSGCLYHQNNTNNKNNEKEINHSHERGFSTENNGNCNGIGDSRRYRVNYSANVQYLGGSSLDDAVLNLAVGMRSSLIGQMMTHLEGLSDGVLGPNINKNENITNITKDAMKNSDPNYDDNCWENVLRSSCSKNILWVDNLKYSEKRKVPFLVRMKHIGEMELNGNQGKNEKKGGMAAPSRLFHLLHLAEKDEKNRKSTGFANNKSVESKYLISERNIFTVFVLQALNQVERFYDSFFPEERSGHYDGSPSGSRFDCGVRGVSDEGLVGGESGESGESGSDEEWSNKSSIESLLFPVRGNGRDGDEEGEVDDEMVDGGVDGGVDGSGQRAALASLILQLSHATGEIPLTA